VPLKPRLVVEASADHIENEHFRHGARLLRFREDKKPEACTMDQIRPARPSAP
jgi:ATP-dependent DNA ligase